MSNSESNTAATAVREAVRDFPSGEGVAKLRDIKNRFAGLVEKRASAARRLHLARENSGAIEAVGGDPTKTFNDAAAELRKIESEIPDAKNELARAFLAETANYETLHRTLWAAVYNEQVLPLVKAFAAIAEKFEQAISGLEKTLESNEGTLADLAAFDARIGDWNKIVRDLGGPLSAEINPALTAQKSVVSSLDNHHQLIYRFEKIIARLKQTLYPPPAPPPPLTEEKLARDRELHREALAEQERRAKVEDELERQKLTAAAAADRWLRT
jgi:hypothetical protein